MKFGEEMKKKVNVFWYKHNEGQGNFGDELSPFIIERLSGLRVAYVDIRYLNDDKWMAIKTLIVNLLRRNIGMGKFFKFLCYNLISKPKVLLAVGSILQITKASNYNIWGSGVIYSRAKFPNHRFCAVRGDYSRQRIKELGYKDPIIVGDPAILLPLIYSQERNKRYKVGIIPHFMHYKDIKEHFSMRDVLVINLLDDFEKIISEICSCEITLSTSLHGIIVSHSYGIPSIWGDFSQTKSKINGDNVKFKDYFSSVKLPEYLPVKIDWGGDRENIQEKIQELTIRYSDVLLPDINLLRELQKGLIEVAPFPVKTEYRK